MSDIPLVSICIPTYNGAKYIEETLDNILSSNYKNFEILCIDDLSTDQTKEIVEKYTKKDSRIKLVVLPKKEGNPAKSILFAVQYCKGEYFFYMSQDDLISADCLSECVETALKTDAEIVVPNMVWYYTNQSNTGGIYPLQNYNKSELGHEEALLGICNYALHGFALKKMTLMKKYPYDTKFIDSTDTSTAKQYYLSNKVVLSGGTFFYRQDNTNALTKMFNFKRLEMLDSRIDLIEFAIEHGIKKLRTISSFYWIIFKKIYAETQQMPSVQDEINTKLKESLRLFRKKMLQCRIYSLYFSTFYFKIRRAVKNKFNRGISE